MASACVCLYFIASRSLVASMYQRRRRRRRRKVILSRCAFAQRESRGSGKTHKKNVHARTRGPVYVHCIHIYMHAFARTQIVARRVANTARRMYLLIYPRSSVCVFVCFAA